MSDELPPLVEPRCAACKRRAPDPESEEARLPWRAWQWSKDLPEPRLLCVLCFNKPQRRAEVVAAWERHRVYDEAVTGASPGPERQRLEDEASEYADECQVNAIWISERIEKQSKPPT